MRRNAGVLRGWEVRIHSDADNSVLVRRYFSDLADEFERLPYGVMRADVARLVYLYVYGGWYADTDYEWLRPPTVEVLEYDLVLPRSREGRPSSGGTLGNAVLASVPGHPFWAEAVREIFLHPIPAALSRNHVEMVTGPGLMTRLQDRAARYPGTWFAPRPLFHTPVSEVHNVPAPGAFGIHHCRGSWRADALRWRLAMAARRVRRAARSGLTHRRPS
jgi:hypothetical protein